MQKGLTRSDWLPAAITGALIIVVIMAIFPYNSGYAFQRTPMLKTLKDFWSGEDWQHCVLVPFAIGYIVYLRRDVLAKLPIRGSLLGGIPLMVLSMLFYLAGYKTNISYLGFGAVQIMVAGLVVFFLGWRWMLELLFPWLFMVFLWPLIFLQDTIAFRLRLIMSIASVDTLNLIGIATVRDGTAILSAADPMVGTKIGERFSVDVADPCSGIRSLFALIMISSLYGYLTMKGWWRVALMTFAAIPLAVLGNLFRILMLTIGTITLGSNIAIGPEGHPSTFHMAAGFFVFVVALAGMLGIGWLIQDLPDKIRKSKGLVPAPADRTLPANATPEKRDDLY